VTDKPPSAAPSTDRILRAILAILLAMACFSVLNAMSKTLSATFPVIEVIWARYFFAFVFMLAIFLPTAGRELFRIRRLDTQVLRGLLLFFSSYLYFHGIAVLPLAEAASISLSSPIIGRPCRRACWASTSGRAAGRRSWSASSAR
jgi:drug/metabolite transporter (DMT)-like permease